MRDCRADSAETQVACGGIDEKEKKKKKQGRSLNGERLGMVGLRVEECVIMYGGCEWVVFHIISRRQTPRGNTLPQEGSNGGEQRYSTEQGGSSLQG